MGGLVFPPLKFIFQFFRDEFHVADLQKENPSRFIRIGRGNPLILFYYLFTYNSSICSEPYKNTPILLATLLFDAAVGSFFFSLRLSGLLIRRIERRLGSPLS